MSNKIRPWRKKDKKHYKRKLKFVKEKKPLKLSPAYETATHELELHGPFETAKIDIR